MTTPWLFWERGAPALADWAESVRLSHGADRLACWGPAPGHTELRAVFWTGAPGPPLPAVPIGGHALGWVYREGVSLRAEAREIFRGLDAGWAIAVPIPDPEGVVIGVLSTEFLQPPAPDAVRSLELAGAAAGRLLYTAEAYRATADDLRKDRALRESLEKLQRELDLDALARSACAAALEAGEAAGALTALWEPEEDEGRVIAVAGHLPEDWVGRSFRGEDSHLGLALRTATVLPREHARAWGELAPFLARADGPPIACFVVAPMLDKEPPVGALAVSYERPRAFREVDVRRLEILARFVGPAIRQASQFARIAAEAKVDPLTGLANRRGFEERMWSEGIAAQTGRISLALISVDIDRFKEVNDRWGHEAGDAALRTVAAKILESIRPGDAAGRWGGEELLVLLPGASLEVAAEVAERIRRAVEAAEFCWGGQPVPLRVSAGVSAFPEIVSRPDRLLASADAALYHAKRQGRNVVAVAERVGRRGFALYRKG